MIAIHLSMENLHHAWPLANNHVILQTKHETYPQSKTWRSLRPATGSAYFACHCPTPDHAVNSKPCRPWPNSNPTKYLHRKQITEAMEMSLHSFVTRPHSEPEPAMHFSSVVLHLRILLHKRADFATNKNRGISLSFHLECISNSLTNDQWQTTCALTVKFNFG